MSIHYIPTNSATRVYHEGREAGMTGQHHECPYPADTDAAWNWERGYMDARTMQADKQEQKASDDSK